MDLGRPFCYLPPGMVAVRWWMGWGNGRLVAMNTALSALFLSGGYSETPQNGTMFAMNCGTFRNLVEYKLQIFILRFSHGIT